MLPLCRLVGVVEVGGHWMVTVFAEGACTALWYGGGGGGWCGSVRLLCSGLRGSITLRAAGEYVLCLSGWVFTTPRCVRRCGVTLPGVGWPRCTSGPCGLLGLILPPANQAETQLELHVSRK